MSTMTDSIGRVLAGRYRIESALGTGASAHVFCARDIKLRRRVAIKLLHPALATDGAFLRRFRAEAQAAAALTHPHVLSVYDWGEDENGPFLVLEFLGGGSLRDLLDEGHHLSVAQAVPVGAQAAEGLAYAHGRGFVHRDIKPANLIFDEEGRLRIADFGLARALAEAALTEPAGATVGTARYAAPEQALGKLVDGRADVYALALVLYEAVTGVVPFTADTTISTLMARVGARLPGNDLLGPLGSVLRDAATPEVEDRLDASRLAHRLSELAARLPAPEPLPLEGSALGAARRRSVAAMDDAGVVDAGDRTEHGIQPSVLPTDAPGGSPGRVREGPSDPQADSDNSQLLAMASAVGVASEPREPAAPEGAAAGATRSPPGDQPRPRRRRLRTVGAVVLVLLLVGGGLAYGAIETKLFTPSHRLPDVVDLTIGQASTRLRPDHFPVSVSGRRSSVTVATGHVLREIPGAGASLKEGTGVLVVVSSGPPPVPVPSLAGLVGGCPAVTAKLVSAHLHTDCTYEHSTQVANGGVVDWNPKTKATEFSAVDVSISLGPPIVTYPSLSGITTCTGVTSAFAAVGLTAACTVEYSSTVPSGGLVSENPPNQAPEGSTVGIVLSKGPAPVPVPAIPSNGRLTDEIDALQSAGLVPGNVYGPANGRVFQTNPSPGQMVLPGTSVDIYTIS
jgi:serine/threonine-protein kinase